MTDIGELLSSKSDSYIENLRQRFDEKVDKTGDCHTWTAYKSHGYGMIKVCGKVVRAHRLSAYFAFGDISNDDILHKCHNRDCVNRKHLKRGDLSENRKDTMRQENVFGQKLTYKDAEKIREEYKQYDITQTELAEKYGVNQGRISRIVRGKAWSKI